MAFSFNLDTIGETVKDNVHIKSKQGGNPNRWQTIKAWEMEIGAPFTFRWAPMQPDKSPTGVLFNLIHEVYHSPTQDPKKVVCGKRFDLNASCTICDTLKTILKSDKLKPEIREFVEKCRHKGDIHMPLIGFAHMASEEPASWTPPGASKPIEWMAKNWVPKEMAKENEAGFQLRMKMNNVSTDAFLSHQLPKLKGRKENYFRIVRTAKNAWEIQPTDQMGTIMNPDILEHYPRFVNYNKDDQLSEIEMQALLEDCFWWKYVKKLPGVEFPDEVDLSKMSTKTSNLDDLDLSELEDELPL